jgi:beta-galactosidase
MSTQYSSHRWLLCLLLSALLPLLTYAYAPPGPTRIDHLINDSWVFTRSDVKGAETPSFNDSSWTKVNIPHTWNNMDGQDGGSYYRGIGWYRKRLRIGPEFRDRNIYIKFEAANMVTDVYLNGTSVGQHRGGYSAFCFNITRLIKIGEENILAVKVNNAGNSNIAPVSADFTFFGGIYRDVHLISTAKVAISPMDYASSGVYLKPTNVSAGSANLEVTAKVSNDHSTPRTVIVSSKVVDAGGQVVKELISSQEIGAGALSTIVQSTVISQPHLWDGRTDPYLYRVFVEVQDGGQVVDVVDQPLGFRYFSVDANKGFFLNGRYLDLRGASRHQDRLNKGWAISRADHAEDMALIKEVGATAIRLAHYQHADYFYELSDRNGMVVWAEIPFVNIFTSGSAFSDNVKQQMMELIKQNYNHPSIMFWGIYNELRPQYESEATPLLHQLIDMIHKEDPTRLSTCAQSRDQGNYYFYTDVTGFNKYFGWYDGSYNDIGSYVDNKHSKNPTKKIGISEYGAGGSIKQHAINPKDPNPFGDFHSEEYQNQFHEAYWKVFKTRPFLWCKFVWNMFDFAVDSRDEGDTKGRNDKGLVTYDRKTRKDAFYWYKANWSDEPVVYITSRRFIPSGTVKRDVKVYSNAESVELKVGGQSKGVIRATGDKIFVWKGMNFSRDDTLEAIGIKGTVRIVDTVDWSGSAPPTELSAIVPLSAGWNLISLPLQPTDNSIQVVLSEIAGQFEVLYSYDSSLNRYQTYIPGSTANDLSVINAGIGYWIYMRQAKDLSVKGSTANQSITLKAGWNLIGFNSRNALSVVQAIRTIESKISVIYSFDSTSNTYKTYIPNSLMEFQMLEPGKGYWIYALEDVTWEQY